MKHSLLYVLGISVVMSAMSAQAATVTYNFDAGTNAIVSGNLAAGAVGFAYGLNADSGTYTPERGWYNADTSGDYRYFISARNSDNQGDVSRLGMETSLDMTSNFPSYASFELMPASGESLDFSSATVTLDAILYYDSTATYDMGYKVWANTGGMWTALDAFQTVSSTQTAGSGSLFEVDESTPLSAGNSMDQGIINKNEFSLNFSISSLGTLAADQTVTIAVALSGTRDAQWNFGSAMDNIVVNLPALTGGNTPPSSTNNAYNVSEDDVLNVPEPGVLANDGDADGDSLTASKKSDPSNGSLTLNSDGSFTYTPNPGFAGADSFTYTAHDGSVPGNIATVFITVDPIPSTPDGLDDAYSVVRGSALNVSAPGVLMNDEDGNGDALSALQISGVSSGSLTLNTDGSFDYTPAVGYTGTVSFTYAPMDGSSTGNTSTVSVQVYEPIAVERPNILIFFCDDMGIGDSRIYNTSANLPPPQPTIEAFASSGMVFDDAHTQASLCAPSRYCILTGNYAWRGREEGGSWHMNKGAQVMPGQRTIAHVLNSAGYNTSIFGKGHLGGLLTDTNGVADTKGIVWAEGDAKDYVDGKNDSLKDNYYDPTETDWTLPVSNGVCSALVGFDFGYMLYGGIQDPLYAYFENDYIVGNPADLEVWANRDNNYPTPNGQHHTYRPGYGLPGWYTCDVGPTLTQRTMDFIDAHVATNQANGTDNPFFIHYCAEAVHSQHTPPTNFLGTAVAGTTVSPHSDMLFELEVAFSNLLERLDSHGLLDDTLVIFTSDNGGLTLKESDNLGYPATGHNPNEGLREHKATLWEGGHRVPLFIKWGDKIPAGRYPHMVGIHDLYATITQLVGKQQGPEQGLDAVSLLSVLLSGDTSPTRRYLVNGKAGSNNDPAFGVGRALREGPYKLIFDWSGNVPVLLFNLKTDPLESVNLLSDPAQAQRVARMTARMDEIYAGITDPDRHLGLRTEPLPPMRDLNNNGMDDDWEVAYFGSTNAVNGGPYDDWEPDGINNLLEFAFGSNPTVVDDPADVLPDFEIQGDTFEYIYRRRQDAAARGLQYINEQTPDLMTNIWSATGLTEVGSEFIDADIQMVTNHFPISGTTNRFFRLKVEQQ